MTIQQAEDKGKLIEFALVTDETDVNDILSYLGRKRFANSRNINGLFVAQSNGDYARVYGFKGIIPNNDKELFLIH